MANVSRICDILNKHLPAIKIIDDAAPTLYMDAPINYKPGPF